MTSIVQRARSVAVALSQRSWLAVIAAFIVQGMVIGASIYSFGVFVKPLAATFGVGRAEVSGAYLVYTVVGAVAAPVVGFLITSHSIRLIMLIGAVLTAAGFGLLATATSMWQVYLYFGLVVGLGNALGGVLACTALVVGWFEKDRGLALGISLFGASAGAPVLVALATVLVNALDWRWTAAVFGGGLGLVLPPVIWFLVYDPPGAARRRPSQPPGTPDADRGFILGLLRDPKLWLAVVILGFGAAPSVAVIQTLHSHVTDLRFAPETAAIIVGGMSLVGACAKPLFGSMADRAGLRLAITTTLLLQSAALALLAVGDHVIALAAAAGLFGLGYGGLAPLISLLLSSLFGTERFPKVLGLMTTVLLPFSLVGFPFASWVQDRTGSYAPAYLTFVGFLALSLAGLSRVRRNTRAGLAAAAASPGDG